ncbi:MAG: hypothetical protein Q8847_02495 [Sweet potato little leaf phytoplasma]|nr:hypothetical protein [Sweet potato little leaf phytoplasma]
MELESGPQRIIDKYMEGFAPTGTLGPKKGIENFSQPYDLWVGKRIKIKITIIIMKNGVGQKEEHGSSTGLMLRCCIQT